MRKNTHRERGRRKQKGKAKRERWMGKKRDWGREGGERERESTSNFTKGEMVSPDTHQHFITIVMV